MTTENLDEPLDPRERAALRRKEIDACEMCDDEGYNPSGPFLVCDHIDRREINERGMALVRKALASKDHTDRSEVNRRGKALVRKALEDQRDREPQLSGNPTVDPEPEL
jgi:hypothetical protein